MRGIMRKALDRSLVQRLAPRPYGVSLSSSINSSSLSNASRQTIGPKVSSVRNRSSGLDARNKVSSTK
ncbi:hypothetical protein D3C80_1747450 [compost metagenome]